jgi:hypothetical protein
MDQIGDIKSINGTSVQLNNQPGQGGVKPSASGGKADPGGHKPERTKEEPVPMPK